MTQPETEPEPVRLQVGPVAHGGHCVARLDGRVVFVRHALPGETVLARLTEHGEGKRFWRADAVEVLDAAPGRVPRRCPVSGPGGCGGCDWQHVEPAAQRELKHAVVAEQLRRLAGLEPEFAVEALSGAPDGLGWRTRVRFAVDGQGRPGFRRHRSHHVVPVPPEGCPIAHPGVNAAGPAGQRLSGVAAAEVVASSTGEALVVLEPAPGRRVRPPRVPSGTAVAVRDGTSNSGLTRLRGRARVTETVTVAGRQRPFRVSGAGFWQVHPAAAQTWLDAVLAAAEPRPGEAALDLYSGVGLFAAGLAEAVGAQGSVLAVEADARAGADARRNLHDLPQVRCVTAPVDAALAGVLRADVVVLDPPRSGAGPALMRRLAGLGPRVMVYVACDPAALARDVAALAGEGYGLSGLRAFDAFPMTHHVECIATLAR